MRGADIGNLSPPSQLRVRSSAVSGMGGMSSVPCARERAELVRAWWVTASGSGVAICGDTGTKLDRPVPAGFETEPARDPGKSPRAGCLGHHHQTFKSGHDVRRASRTPLIAPGFCPWRISCFLISKHTVFPGSAQRCPGPTGRGSRFTQQGRSRICSLPAQACIREKWEWEEKDALMLPPDLFRGLAAFQMQAQPGPGTGAGEVEGAEERAP